MNKLGLGITLVCTSFLGFIGGVFTMSRHQEKETQPEREDTLRLVKELRQIAEEAQKTKNLLETEKLSKTKELLKVEGLLELEREQRVDDRQKFQKKIKSLEEQLNTDVKTDNTTL